MANYTKNNQLESFVQWANDQTLHDIPASLLAGQKIAVDHIEYSIIPIKDSLLRSPLAQAKADDPVILAQLTILLESDFGTIANFIRDYFDIIDQGADTSNALGMRPLYFVGYPNLDGRSLFDLPTGQLVQITVNTVLQEAWGKLDQVTRHKISEQNQTVRNQYKHLAKLLDVSNVAFEELVKTANEDSAMPDNDLDSRVTIDHLEQLSLAHKPDATPLTFENLMAFRKREDYLNKIETFHDISVQDTTSIPTENGLKLDAKIYLHHSENPEFRSVTNIDQFLYLRLKTAGYDTIEQIEWIFNERMAPLFEFALALKPYTFIKTDLRPLYAIPYLTMFKLFHHSKEDLKLFLATQFTKQPLTKFIPKDKLHVELVDDLDVEELFESLSKVIFK